MKAVVQVGLDPLSMMSSQAVAQQPKPTAVMFQQPTIKEDFMDQMRQQTKQVNEIEAMKMLEPGEVVVVCIDKIKELATRIGVSIDGKLYITNYRV